MGAKKLKIMKTHKEVCSMTPKDFEDNVQYGFEIKCMEG